VKPYTRTIYRWDGIRWNYVFQDSFLSHPPGFGTPYPVPSAKGLTASTTIAGLDGAPYLWETWFEKHPNTWGTGFTWYRVAQGGNW
jgi:hypothetical protein